MTAPRCALESIFKPSPVALSAYLGAVAPAIETSASKIADALLPAVRLKKQISSTRGVAISCALMSVAASPCTHWPGNGLEPDSKLYSVTQSLYLESIEASSTFP